MLVNPASGKCLDPPGGSSADGTPVVIWDCHGGPSQHWDVPGEAAALRGVLDGCPCEVQVLLEARQAPSDLDRPARV